MGSESGGSQVYMGKKNSLGEGATGNDRWSEVLFQRQHNAKCLKGRLKETVHRGSDVWCCRACTLLYQHFLIFLTKAETATILHCYFII
jgi:ribosomal protein L37AE/L43A